MSISSFLFPCFDSWITRQVLLKRRRRNQHEFQANKSDLTLSQEVCAEISCASATFVQLSPGGSHEQKMLVVSWGRLLRRESEALKDSLSESGALQQDLRGGLYKPPLLVTQWTTPPHYLSRLWIKVWGLHIKQSQAFDVQRNTNTDLTRVVTAYLSPLVIHSLLVECLSLQRLLSVGLAYSSHAGFERPVAHYVEGLGGHLASC
ncbi:hypothetical protein Q8A67_013811 [Cirrhinus molitorella]|uniref:Uncharacterized protein n=2 Tax=Cirrhinus molitorella TaxID=172907 RepID=A0AA88PLU0_9TELE|nr:hypothetical protein Q8A67_013811 [Cirrhinus molitorella]